MLNFGGVFISIYLWTSIILNVFWLLKGFPQWHRNIWFISFSTVICLSSIEIFFNLDTPQKTNISPKKWWLEDEIGGELIMEGYFSCCSHNFRFCEVVVCRLPSDIFGRILNPSWVFPGRISSIEKKYLLIHTLEVQNFKIKLIIKRKQQQQHLYHLSYHIIYHHHHHHHPSYIKPKSLWLEVPSQNITPSPISQKFHPSCILGLACQTTGSVDDIQKYKTQEILRKLKRI